MAMKNNASTALYDLLVTRDFEPEVLDSTGKAVTNPEEAELFSFDWKTPEKNYGTVVVLVNENNQLEVYYGDNVGKAMDSGDKTQWYQFLEQMKQFAMRNLMSFELRNINKLKYTMQGMAAIKEGLFEGYYGTKKVSYSDQPQKTRLVIKHSRNLGEDEARYRNIDSLFVETAEGERYKVPSRSLVHGKLLARHISEGGNPYDTFGQHITDVMNEIATLSRFVRASRNKNFTGDVNELVETAVRHYQALKSKAKRMLSKRGYYEERENFDPAAFSDSEVTCEAIRDLFVEQSLDQRIEEALPILARLQETGPVKEAEQFAKWADRVVEGTWALPDSKEAQDQLREILAQELLVGPDATNAAEQIYELIGDDELFDRLQDLAMQDPDADARPIIQDRLRELGYDLDNSNNVDENIDTDGIMRTVASNMSSESVLVQNHLKRILELAKK
jgi:hypothetical protein